MCCRKTEASCEPRSASFMSPSVAYLQSGLGRNRPDSDRPILARNGPTDRIEANGVKYKSVSAPDGFLLLYGRNNLAKQLVYRDCSRLVVVHTRSHNDHQIQARDDE